MIRNIILRIVLLCVSVSATAAQNYHPADIGNTWILESQDGAERLTYTLEPPDEDFSSEQFRNLKIASEVLGASTVNTGTFLIEVGEEGMKLHRVFIEFGDVFGVADMELSPSAVFFPPTLQIGDTWELRGESEVNLIGDITISSVNEVVAIEDVETPAGMFENCLKIRMFTKTTAAFGSTRSTSYQWLAPDFGPVKFETDQDIVFELISANLSVTEKPYDVNADGVVNILDLTFVASHFGGTDPKADVNSDGTVNILDLTLVAQNFGN